MIHPLTRRVTALCVLLVLPHLLACTEYTAVRGVSDAGVQPQVRVTLTDQGRVDAAPRVGLRAQRVEGRLTSMTDSTLSLSVRKVTREGSIEDNYEGDELTLSARDYDAVEKSQTSVPRSILAAGAIIVSAFVVARVGGDVTGSKSGGPASGGK